MTEQEKINNEVQLKLALTDAKFNQFMEATKDRDKERAEDMREIRTSIATMSKHLRNLTVATIVGVGAIAVTAIGAIASIVLK